MHKSEIAVNIGNGKSLRRNFQSLCKLVCYIGLWCSCSLLILSHTNKRNISESKEVVHQDRAEANCLVATALASNLYYPREYFCTTFIVKHIILNIPNPGSSYINVFFFSVYQIKRYRLRSGIHFAIEVIPNQFIARGLWKIFLIIIRIRKTDSKCLHSFGITISKQMLV